MIILRKKPIVLIILDGYGFSHNEFGNAVYNAKTPFLNEFIKSHPHVLLNASGEAVGLPKNQIGNSEVGHLHIGAGRTVYTGLMLINNAIQNNQFICRNAFIKCVEHVKIHNSKVHILGLLSPGGVHSHEEHIFHLANFFGKKKVKCVLHIFCDGRDVPPMSVISSIKKLQTILKKFPNVNIGTVSGRYYAMDRDQRWERSMKYYNALISGNCENYFSNLEQYIASQYEKNISDEFIEPAVTKTTDLQEIVLNDNDAVIFANFRSDRARQLAHLIFASGYYNFNPPNRRKNLFFVTMTKYEGTNESTVAFDQPKLINTFGEYISNLGYSQVRIAETEKYAHVTFFFDGGCEKVLLNCRKILVPSKKVATYDLFPAMSCVEITDRLIEVASGYNFIIVNFANPDMVGHTGNYEKTVLSLEKLDEQLNRIFEWINKINGTIFLTADHGNAETMLTNDGKPVTSHTSNPVFFVCSDNKFSLANGDLGNVAPTILEYAGLPIPVEMTKKSLIHPKK